MQKAAFENHSEDLIPEPETRVSPMEEEVATDMKPISSDDSFQEEDNVF